jgi:hypothetical protein
MVRPGRGSIDQARSTRSDGTHYTGVHRRGLTIAFDGREALTLLIETGRSGKSRRLELGEGD